MRRQVSSRDIEELAAHRALLAALSDDLTLPLLQIKGGIELVGRSKNLSKTANKHLHTMDLSANDGLQLIEAYRLLLRTNNYEDLQLEPVAVGALLQDAAHLLTPYAKHYDTSLELDIQGRLTPVLAHGPSLVAAMQCLSASLIRAQAAQSRQKNHRLILAAHRGADQGITTGAFSNVQGLSDRTLRAARSLVGRARQPLPAVPAGAASGILVADMLCAAMWQPLRAAAHHGLGGLATAVPASRQLQFM